MYYFTNYYAASLAPAEIFRGERGNDGRCVEVLWVLGEVGEDFIFLKKFKKLLLFLGKNFQLGNFRYFKKQNSYRFCAENFFKTLEICISMGFAGQVNRRLRHY